MRAAIAILLLCSAACGGKERMPADLLDRERFTALLVDAQIVEARINHELIVDHLGTVPMAAYYQELFARYGVEEELFARTFRWYANHPDQLKAIYEDVLTELARRKDLPVEP